MKFDQKYQALMQLRPDIAIVPECAKPEVLSAKAQGFRPTSTVWCGDSANKGLSVFAFGDYRLEPGGPRDPSLKYVMPVDVKGPTSLKVLATWAFMGKNDMQNALDPGPLLRSTFIYEDELKAGRTIMAGDYNNHVRWDRPRNPRNFGDYLARMEALGLASAYHELHGEPVGKETAQTHFWRDRKINSATNFHIDYIFAPKAWLASNALCEIGSHSDWCGNGLSDHVPVVMEFAQ